MIPFLRSCQRGIVAVRPDWTKKTSLLPHSTRYYSDSQPPLSHRVTASRHSTQAPHWFLPSALFGGLFAAWYLQQEDENGLLPTVHGATASDLRFENVDNLDANTTVNPESIGLVKDPRDPDLYMLKSSKLPDNPLRAKVVDGQLMWESACRRPNCHNMHTCAKEGHGSISYKHVQEIGEFYRTLNPQRSLLIQTGIHGGPSGKVIHQKKEEGNLFAREDFAFFQSDAYHFVALRELGFFTKALSHADIRVDIFNAWCYSRDSKDYSKLQPIASSRSILRYFTKQVDILGFPSTLRNNTAYQEFGNLRGNIEKQLADTSFCYVHGVGGMGKSRVAWEVEHTVRESMQADDSPYMDTVFISLKSETAKLAFKDHVNRLIPDQSSQQANIQKYFRRLGQLAQGEEKQVLIVVDNIDTPDDFAFLNEIYDALGEFHQPGRESVFKLIVTGRSSLSEFLMRRQLPLRAVVTMEEYCQGDTMWNLFSAEFLKTRPPEDQPNGKIFLEKERVRLTKIIADLGNNTAVTLLLAYAFAASYQRTEENQLFDICGDTLRLVKGIDNKSDKIQYTLQEMLQPIFNYLIRYGEDAFNLLEVCALLSGGPPIELPWCTSLLAQYYTALSLEQLDFFALDEILENLENAGLIKYEKRGVFTMPPLYRGAILNRLSRKYNEDAQKKDHIVKLLTVVVDSIESQLNQNPSSTKFSDWMSFLLSIFNYAKPFGFMQSLSERISCLVALRLGNLTYERYESAYKALFSEAANKPGYSLNAGLAKTILSNDPEVAQKDLVVQATGLLHQYNHTCARLEEATSMRQARQMESKTSTPSLQETNLKKDVARLKELIFNVAMSLNNFSVHCMNRNIPCQEAMDMLRRTLAELDDNQRAIIEANVFSAMPNKTRRIYPQFQLYTTSPANRKKAEEWKAKHLSISKSANLSATLLGDGLRDLRTFLLEERKIEDLNLSSNQLGFGSDGRLLPVVEFLRYPGSLKTLNLSHNFLNDSKQFSDLVEGLSSNTTLEMLDLKNNSLDDGKIEQLCHALRHHPKIKRILLANNCFSSIGVDQLEALMKENPHIESITTQWNFWRRSDTKEIVRRGNDIEQIKI